MNFYTRINKMESCQWKRHLFVVLTHLAFAIMFLQRLNLSIAIVAMVGPENQANITKEENDRSTIRLKAFDWDEAHQGMISVLSSMVMFLLTFQGEYLWANMEGS